MDGLEFTIIRLPPKLIPSFTNIHSLFSMTTRESAINLSRSRFGEWFKAICRTCLESGKSSGRTVHFPFLSSLPRVRIISAKGVTLLWYEQKPPTPHKSPEQATNMGSTCLRESCVLFSWSSANVSSDCTWERLGLTTVLNWRTASLEMVFLNGCLIETSAGERNVDVENERAPIFRLGTEFYLMISVRWPENSPKTSKNGSKHCQTVLLQQNNICSTFSDATRVSQLNDAIV